MAIAPAIAAIEPELADAKVAVATQLQLTWWRFRKHRVAVWSAGIVLLFYVMAILADFLATTDPHITDAKRSFIPPQPIHWIDSSGSFAPHVFALKGRRDPRTFKLIYAPDPAEVRYLTLFGEGFSYNFLGFIPTNRHLLGVTDAKT